MCKFVFSQINENMEQEVILNEHNKQEYPPMHTAEHILNGTMVKLFGLERSRNAHIERKKSKCDYPMAAALTPEQIALIEQTVNGVIERNLDVTVEFARKSDMEGRFDVSRLPGDASGKRCELFMWAIMMSVCAWVRM